MVFAFILLIWHIILINFGVLKQPCIPGTNPIFSWWINPFICFQIWFVNIVLRSFVSMFLRYWSIVFFSCMVCLCYQNTTSPRDKVFSVWWAPPSPIFKRVCAIIVTSHLYMFHIPQYRIIIIALSTLVFKGS